MLRTVHMLARLDLGVGSTSPDPAPACPGGTPRRRRVSSRRAGAYGYGPRSQGRARRSRSRASSVSPRAPRRGSVRVPLRPSSNYEYRTRTVRRIGASRPHGTPAGALTGARPVKPAVGWYMPVEFRTGQNRATCRHVVRGPCADPSWSSVEQLFMRHGSISPLPPRTPFFPHYASWMSRWPHLRAGSVAHST